MSGFADWQTRSPLMPPRVLRHDRFGAQLPLGEARQTGVGVHPADGPDAVGADPGGAGFGLWQAGAHIGFSDLDDPGAPNWFELHTHVYEEVLEFYRAVLGWQTQVVPDVSGFRYSTVVADGEQVCGVMDAVGFPP